MKGIKLQQLCVQIVGSWKRLSVRLFLQKSKCTSAFLFIFIIYF